MAIRWSKVKTRVRGLLAPSVQARVDFHSTRYRHAHDGDGRGWITLDGEEIINMSTVVAWRTQHNMAKRMQEAFASEIPAYTAGWNAATEFMHQESIFWQGEFGSSLFDYANLAIDAILACENPIIRGMSALDRRAGRRAIEALKADAHPLVARLATFRACAEGW